MEDSQLFSKQNLGKMLNKVPEVTLYFWVIKVLCTTVGETASDFLNVNLGLGLTGTSIIMGIVLAVALFFQIKSKKYIPSLYWLSVFLISIFGTLVTDNLTDGLGVPLELSTIVFSVLLAITFAVWYFKEKTLSIHSIHTRKRESFYWLAILFTFALGTAAGDLTAESLGLGYLVTGIIVCVIIALVTISWLLGLDAVLSFWICYIMTRPLGASLGDYLSQTTANGGLGLGATWTTVIFVLAIICTVTFLAITKKDQILKSAPEASKARPAAVLLQVLVVVLVLVVFGSSGYYYQHSKIQKTAAATVTADAPLGDLSEFKTISTDTLALVQAGKLTDAKTRIKDFETAWDDNEVKLRPMSPSDWSKVDSAADKMLRQLRASHPDAAGCESSLQTMITLLNALDKK